MSIALFHPGAATRELAFAAADRMRAQALRAVQPANRAFETPDQVREQVLADRGVDRIALMGLNAQARLEAEISINAETTQRVRQASIRSTGNYIDLRV